MIGVLIKNGLTVIEKRVYGGDTNNVLGLIADFQVKNPSVTVEIHQDTDPDWIAAFDKIVPVSLPTATQTAWQTAKAAGAQQAILFIAKVLGLE